MKHLLFGTYNPAKLDLMRRYLAGLPIVLDGLFSLDAPPAEADETGDTTLENARIKAIWYCRATGMPTLAADSALFIDGIPADEQPAAHARRMGGTRMTDEEMQAHFAALVHAHGGRLRAQYRNAACIAFPDGRILCRDDERIATKPFYLVDTPHAKRVVGFPLDSLSVEIQSGAYYYDLTDSLDNPDAPGAFAEFVQEALRLQR